MAPAGCDPLPIPARWDDVDAAWMTAALAPRHPGVEVAAVELRLRDDGTNRRARFAVTYAAGTGPRSVFVKAESDVDGRREIHARNGNLFNEPRLFASGVELPVEHPRPYAVAIDEPGLDYLIVMEDVLDRGADARDATRPLTVDQVANGVRSLARLHSRYWDRVDDDEALAWVTAFVPTDGWQAPMRAGVPHGVRRAGDAIPDAVRSLTGDALVDLWVRYVDSLSTGDQTLLHGDAHVGNTYLLPDGEVGFLDWQVVRRGHWSHDVGYFVVGALTEDDRRAHEVELVEEHRRALAVDEAERPAAADAWLRYRATPAHGLPLWLLTLLSDVHRHEVSLALARRYAAAFVELDTPGALDALDT
jgi:aminoglycoside phosphotransferase (APT) family kinase protein